MEVMTVCRIFVVSAVDLRGALKRDFPFGRIAARQRASSNVSLSGVVYIFVSEFQYFLHHLRILPRFAWLSSTAARG
ncbi:MAG: hypothetical protein ACLRMJ_01710 [Alistipes finegoldii]